MHSSLLDGALAVRGVWLAAAVHQPVAGISPLWPTSGSMIPLHRVQRTRKLLAQDGWTAAVDESSGATYYYNEQSGESQWEQPLQPSHRGEPLWRLAGVSGTLPLPGTRPFKLRDGDTTVLGRFNTVEQKLTVSRLQCIVCFHDGVATLTSCGRGPTLWRQRGQPWVALEDADQVPLTDGDQISLECNDPEGAVFACEEDSALQQGTYDRQGGFAQQGGQQQQSGDAQYGGQEQQGGYVLPYPWEQLADQDGAVYYSNPATGEAQWDPPQGG